MHHTGRCLAEGADLQISRLTSDFGFIYSLYTGNLLNPTFLYKTLDFRPPFPAVHSALHDSVNLKLKAGF